MNSLDLGATLDAIQSELNPKAPHDMPSGPLFHYTDATGFREILAKRTVWATDCRFLNDTGEVQIGERHFREVAVELHTKLASETQRFLLANLIAYHDKDSVSKAIPPLIASFSADGNLLSQWRAYGANGSGYSIGFTAADLPLPTGPAPSAEFGMWLLRCEYDEEPFRQAVRNTLTMLATRYEQAHDAYGKDRDSSGRVGGTFIALGLRHAGALVPRLKHHAFREEQEWRLLLFPRRDSLSKEITYRPSPRGLIPYVSIQLASGDKPLPVERVYLGPTQPPEALTSARSFLQGLGYSPEIAVRSGIPYRT